MPWTIEDVDSHIEGLDDKQKEQWVAVANAALEACEADGGEDCDAKAIMAANAAVKEEAKPEPEAAPTEESIQEAATVKAQAQGLLRIAKGLLGEKTLPQAIHAAIDSLRAALKRTWADLEADTPPEKAEDEPTKAPETALATEAAVLSEAVTKTEDGKAFPASDFAYVPDAEKPSTWKLRLTSEPGGEPDAKIVGAAVAALGKGFRGQKVDIPEDDLPAVKAKVRAAWKKANPDRDKEEMPPVLKEAESDARAEDAPAQEAALDNEEGAMVELIEAVNLGALIQVDKE